MSEQTVQVFDQKNHLKVFDPIKANIQLYVKPIFEMKIDSNSSLELVTDAARELKNFEKKVETRRKELVGPFNDHVKVINGYAQSVAALLEPATAHLKTEMKKWEAVLEQKRVEEQKRLDEERKRLESEAAEKARVAKEEAEAVAAFGSTEDGERAKLLAQAEAETEQAAIIALDKKATKEVQSMRVSGAKKVWTFTLKDESQVPREYLVVDEKKIREAIRAGVREIPGVEIFQDTQIAIR